jgi:hypothetical protein
MERLNGWQRIGVVLSILWFFVGGFLGNQEAIREGADPAIAIYGMCMDAAHGRENNNPKYDVAAALDECGREFIKNDTAWTADHWYVALFVGLVPIPLAWLLVWGLISLYRWMGAGFRLTT